MKTTYIIDKIVLTINFKDYITRKTFEKETELKHLKLNELNKKLHEVKNGN